MEKLKNPKAQERLKQLMQNVKVTPNYQMGGSVYPVNYVPQAQNGDKLNPFNYPRPDHYSGINPFLVRDPEHGIFVGGVNPTYSTDDFSIGASMVGVGNKDFQKLPADYGIRGSYNPSKNLSINANLSKNNVGAGMSYRFENGGEVAQNGQEMQYYREGLDFQPKTISKNGGWLDGYDKAQNGKQKNALSILDDVYKRKQQGQYKNVKVKDERGQMMKPSESTAVKRKDFDAEQSKSSKAYYNAVIAQKKEDARRAKLTKDQREREDYNARNEERGSY